MAEGEFFRIDSFIGLAKKYGFARSNRFAVNFFPPKQLVNNSSNQNLINTTMSNEITMLCEEATFPGKRIDTRTLRINSLNEQRANTADYMGKEVHFKFLVDNSWQSRIFFERWMNIIVPPIVSDNGESHDTWGGREVGFYRDYIGTVSIYSLAPILNETDANHNFNHGRGAHTHPVGNVEKEIFGMVLREAWPTAIDNQQTGSSIEGYHRLGVTFTCKWWENVNHEIGLQALKSISVFG